MRELDHDVPDVTDGDTLQEVGHEEAETPKDADTQHDVEGKAEGGVGAGVAEEDAAVEE